jgi:glucose-1-phosphate thymidylyltransferase
MKAVILAGGHATRLWPITKNRAKPLLPLGEQPIIDYMIEEIDDEVGEVIISTNQKFAADFEDYIEEYDRNARVVVESQGSEEEKPGTIGAIIKLLDKEDLQDDLLIVGGDNYFGFSFHDLLDFCREKDAPVNVVYDVNDLEMAEQFGIVDAVNQRITGFEEKPEEPPSTLASTACYFFPEEHVSLFHEYDEYFQETDVPAETYLDEPGRLIEWAHKKTDMYAFDFEGEWHDVGTAKGYLQAQDAVLDESLVKGTTENCEVGENVFIMEGAKLEEVTIENAIVFPHAEIENSDLRNSIIDSKATVKNMDLNDALIGAHSTI